MTVIKTNLIPNGFSAMNLFGILLLKKGKKLTPTLINHEKIHTEQMWDLWFFGFYLLYFIEWVIKSIYYMSLKEGYKNISFEREAYMFDDDSSYLDRRVSFNWMRLIYLK